MIWDMDRILVNGTLVLDRGYMCGVFVFALIVFDLFMMDLDLDCFFLFVIWLRCACSFPPAHTHTPYPYPIVFIFSRSLFPHFIGFFILGSWFISVVFLFSL